VRYVTLTLCVALVSISAGFAAGPPWNPAQSQLVCTEAHDQLRPAIGIDEKLGLIVLWEDKRPDGKKEGTKHTSSIYGKTLADGKEFVVFCPKDANAADPAISGRRAGIYKRNIDTDPDPVRICKNPGTAARNPRISGSIIVWTDNRSGSTDI